MVTRAAADRWVGCSCMRFFEICGVRELQKYLVNQVQEVYRLQGVDINDKHIEIIVRQMLQKVRVTDPVIRACFMAKRSIRKHFEIQNRKVMDEGGKPAQATPVLLGITKASLTSDSFVSAASFQETTRVLTDAACEGKEDLLLDFKANVIMGHMIPGGTGFAEFNSRVEKYLKEEEEDILVFNFS